MEAIGGVGAVAGLIQQSIELLDRVKMALDRQKHNAMYLSVVLQDVEATQSIVQQIRDNPNLQNDALLSVVKLLLEIVTQLSTLVSDQEAKANKGGGFRTFSHHFVSGPHEQQELEALRTNLVSSKNTLILAIVAQIAPSGPSLNVSNVKMAGIAWMNNAPIRKSPEDKGFDHIKIKDVEMKDAALMMNTILTETQLEQLNKDYNRRFENQAHTTRMQDQTRRIEVLVNLAANPGVEANMKKDIFELIKQIQNQMVPGS